MQSVWKELAELIGELLALRWQRRERNRSNSTECRCADPIVAEPTKAVESETKKPVTKPRPRKQTD